MGWNNPPIRWRDLERTLSGRPGVIPDGGDAPGYSRKRDGYEKPTDMPSQQSPETTVYGDRTRVPYAELHCHSNFSFLDGASHPDELIEAAGRMRLDAIALTDHDGMYGVIRFAEAAKEVGIRTVFGSELSLGLSMPQNGIADPEGNHLLVLARNPEGYAALCRSITKAQLEGGEKGRPVYKLDDLAAEANDNWAVLTGCRKGTVRTALAHEGPEGAERELQRLISLFGKRNVFVELTDHGLPEDTDRNDLLVELAKKHDVKYLATNNVHFATAQRKRLAGALAAVRARRSLDEMAGWLPASSAARLRTGEEMMARFHRYPEAVHNAAILGVQCAIDLDLLAPKLPPYPVSPGHSEDSFLRMLAMQGDRKSVV